MQNIWQDVVSHCFFWNMLITKYNSRLNMITKFSYSKSEPLLNYFITLTELLWTANHSPQSNTLRILPTFPNLWECAGEMLQKIFSIGNILSFQGKLKMTYNRKHFLKVLYFLLYKICSTCNDGNWFFSAEITLMQSCSSDLK